MPRGGNHTGLLVDFGGVLTTNVFDSFRLFCRSEGLDADAFLTLMSEDKEARRQLRRVETGDIGEDEFGVILAEKLGVSDSENLIDRLFAGMQADQPMIDAVKKAKAAGIRTGLVSNSIGAGRYDRSKFPEMYDGVVISAEVGLHKPQPEIFLLGAERAGVEPQECVFVDDLRENCQGAEAVGMTAVLHRGAETTLPELERLLGVPGLGQPLGG
ncbi:MAG TPA: HAD family phosphatase [Thermoleophilaceae bacterium]|nr:HAD family phosphatase [Thermoleophilaceae bacterium]